MHLLVHIIIDGSAEIHVAGIFPLTEKLDTHTRREAEKELDSVQERSRTHVMAESPASANDPEDGSTIKVIRNTTLLTSMSSVTLCESLRDAIFTDMLRVPGQHSSNLG